jgi:hypothetical protein
MKFSPVLKTTLNSYKTREATEPKEELFKNPI